MIFVHLITDGKISFADMLEIMHNHSQKENIPQEILRAFRASDKSKTGHISARELRHILLLWGEKLSPKEGNTNFYFKKYLSLPNSPSFGILFGVP